MTQTNSPVVKQITVKQLPKSSNGAQTIQKVSLLNLVEPKGILNCNF